MQRFVTILALLLAVRAGGQQCSNACPGDLNSDGQVTIDELVTAVNSALQECPARPFPTLIPNPTPISTQCTFANTFHALCTYQGRWNAACGDNRLQVHVNEGPGGTVNLILGSGLSCQQPYNDLCASCARVGCTGAAALNAVIDSPTHATLYAWQADLNLGQMPLVGTAELRNSGADLVIDVPTPQFGLDRRGEPYAYPILELSDPQSCPFMHYEGHLP